MEASRNEQSVVEQQGRGCLPCAEDFWLGKGMTMGEGTNRGRIHRQITTRLRGVGLEDRHLDIPAIQVVGCAGGGRFRAENKRVGLQRSVSRPR